MGSETLLRLLLALLVLSAVVLLPAEAFKRAGGSASSSLTPSAVQSHVADTTRISTHYYDNEISSELGLNRLTSPVGPNVGGNGGNGPQQLSTSSPRYVPPLAHATALCSLN